jgi:hypothetical protein
VSCSCGIKCTISLSLLQVLEGRSSGPLPKINKSTYYVAGPTEKNLGTRWAGLAQWVTGPTHKTDSSNPVSVLLLLEPSRSCVVAARCQRLLIDFTRAPPLCSSTSIIGLPRKPAALAYSCWCSANLFQHQPGQLHRSASCSSTSNPTRSAVHCRPMLLLPHLVLFLCC